MALWDELPASLRNLGALSALEPLLSSVDSVTETEEADADVSRKVYRTNIGDDDPLSRDPSAGSFRRGPGNRFNTN